jgi:uracil-DNA glycosylase family 4
MRGGRHWVRRSRAPSGLANGGPLRAGHYGPARAGRRRAGLPGLPALGAGNAGRLRSRRRERPADADRASSQAMSKTARGLPFVGPAGRLLVRALDEGGLDRDDIVRQPPSSKTPSDRRASAAPSGRLGGGCLRPSLVAQLTAARPKFVLLLGATTGKALYGTSSRVRKQPRIVLECPDQGGPRALATIHPSVALRSEDRNAALAGLVADLAIAARLLRAEEPPRLGHKWLFAVEGDRRVVRA